MSETDELARLHDLFVRGAITREEFAAMKAKIIVSSVTENQQATAAITGNSVAYIIVGAICIGWIVTGLARSQ